jgi:RNA polymerase sigma-70 factor (ECF subfamily)
MLAKLPPEQAAAVEFVELRGISRVEAGLLAVVSVSVMKSRVQRGRARLRALLLTCCSVSQDVRASRVAPHTAHGAAASGYGRPVK